MFVIKKGQYYVALPGRKNSYTTDIRYAQKFDTYEQAQKNKCGNEIIVRYQNALRSEGF